MNAIIKLREIVNQGIEVLEEVEVLTGGLNDTIKAVAEELDLKPSILKKAVRIAHKQRLTETNTDHEALNEILESVGRTG